MTRTVQAAVLVSGLLVGQLMTLPTAHAADLCSDFGGAVESDGLCRVHQNKPNYTLTMSFPVDFPDQAAVNDFLTQTRSGFLNETQTPNFANVPYALDMKASLWASDTTKSVSFETYDDFGGAHPNTWYRTFNYDTVRNRPITFEDLFAPGVNALDAIFPIVQQKLGADLGMPDPVSVNDGMDPAHYRNVVITRTDLVFLFDRGELLPGAAGQRTVYVPRSAIPPLAV